MVTRRASADPSQRVHVGHLPVQVHRHQRMGSRSDRGGHSAGIEAVVSLGDVDDDRDSASLRHRLECRDERGSRDDDLIVRLEAGSEQAEPERVEAARDADTVIDAAVLRECRLEARNGGSVRECPRLEELPDLREQPLLQRSACRREVEEGHAADGLRCVLRDHAQTVVAPLPSHHRLIGQLLPGVNVSRGRRPAAAAGLHGGGVARATAADHGCWACSSSVRPPPPPRHGDSARHALPLQRRALDLTMVDVGNVAACRPDPDLAKEPPDAAPYTKDRGTLTIARRRDRPRSGQKRSV